MFTQVLFLSHDAAHRQIFESNKANEWTALLLGTGLGGVSLAWWNTKHNRHHPNQIGKDPDIDASVVHFFPGRHHGPGWDRQCTSARAGGFFPLLVVEALNLHQQSVVDVLTRKTMKRRWLELSLLVFRLAAIPTLAFVLRPGLAVLFLVVQVAVTGVYLGSVFAVSRIGMEIVPADAKINSCITRCAPPQHPRRPGSKRVHGRTQLSDRAPLVPEHAARQPADRADRAPVVLPGARHHVPRGVHSPRVGQSSCAT